MGPWLSWLERCADNAEVVGSNPTGPISFSLIAGYFTKKMGKRGRVGITNQEYQKRDILLALLSVGGILHGVNNLYTLILELLYYGKLSIDPVIFIMLFELTFLIFSLFIWKVIKLSNYYSKYFIIFFVIIFILDLAYKCIIICGH